jgi:hypothetical protein
MIRAEIKTPHRNFVFCEDTIEEAKAYVEAMIENGVVVIKAEYFDRDKRVADIRAGKVSW